MRETYLYPYSAEEACQRGEQSLWRASYLENIDCKDAIQKAVRQHYDGAHLDKECLTEVIQEFGYSDSRSCYKQDGESEVAHPCKFKQALERPALWFYDPFGATPYH